MFHSNQSISLQKPPADVLSNMCLATLKRPKKFVWQSSNLSVTNFQKFDAFLPKARLWEQIWFSP